MTWTLILETCGKKLQPARLGIVITDLKQLVGHVSKYIQHAAHYLQWGCVLSFLHSWFLTFLSFAVTDQSRKIVKLLHLALL